MEPSTDGGFSFPIAPVVPFVQTVHDRLNVEIQRGCPWRCRFCQAGFSYRPYRERTKDELVAIVEEGLRHTGYDAITLAGLSAADHTEIVPLLETLSLKLTPKRISIGLPSTRADRFTLALAEILYAVRRQSLTFAPEGGTERIRRVIRKELEESEIRETIRLAHQHGWKSIKLYFMYGLPTETHEDLVGIVKLIRDSNRENRGLNFTLTLSPFVPKPHTPFQWHAQDRTETLKEKLRFLRKNLPAQIRAHGLEQIAVEGILSRGDRRLGTLLHAVWKLGSKFDEWSERFRYDLWLKAFEQTHLDPEFYCYRERTREEIFPWDHIQGGPEKRALWNDYQTSLRQSAEPVPQTPHLKPRPEVHRPRPISVPAEKSVQRLRFRLKRSGDMRFLSHLEQIEMVRRMLRRAGLPVAATSGFHPQMKISFGPAVSVGYESECELFDVELTRRMELSQVEESVRPQVPAGFQIGKITRIPIFFPSLELLLNRVDYEVSVPPALLGSDPIRMTEKIENFLKPESIVLEKIKKKDGRSEKKIQIDIKPLLVKIEWQSSPDGGGRILMSLKFGPGKNVKPEKIVQLLLGLSDEDAVHLTVIRKAFYIEKQDGTLSDP